MNSSRFRKKSIVSAIALTSAVISGLGSQQVLAQSGGVDEIVITGSRIARDSNLSGPLPVQSVDSGLIENSGEFSISDVVNDMPALLGSETSETSSESDAYDGANILNLRNMGANRTLTLVNGRRHVAGDAGSSAVDIGSIPKLLVERVEVLTGGASAVYGADAVTGVVNFILKDDYEGFTIDASGGMSSEGDSEQATVSALWGINFDEGRGNFTASLEYADNDGLKASDRSDGSLIGSGGNWVNPALRFQQGNISAADTPNFAEYYNYDNTGLTNFGLPIPTADAFIADYISQFGTAPTLTAAEMALIEQAGSAPQRVVLPGRTFPFTSGYGYIIPGNGFTFNGFDPETPIDLDSNGTPDCLDSFSGYNSVFGAASYGVVGGCWNVNPDGSYRPVQDGLIADNFQGFGGDSYSVYSDNTYVLNPEERVNLDLLGHYDLTNTMSVFGELKYSTQEVKYGGGSNSYWDLLYGAPDNPFLPEFIQGVASATDGVHITLDPIGFNNTTTNERTVMRGVIGLEGEFSNGWGYEVSVNHGKFELEQTSKNNIVVDRWFAAIDAVTDPATGEAACRISVDPNAEAMTTPFDIPAYDPGYYSFSPGDCQPLNIWAGQPGMNATQAGMDFVTADSWDKIELEQTVFSAVMNGDLGDYFELPGGPIAFATGYEYRKETSDSSYDDLQRGVIPAGATLPEGAMVSDYSDNASLMFQPSISVVNESGEYDVNELFVEGSFPILAGYTGVEEFTIGAAARYSDYSTVGETTTWKVDALWTIVEDFSLRATQSQAIRAPNITELFGPEVGDTYRPVDPCDAAQINAIRDSDPGLAANYEANCAADLAAIGYDVYETGSYDFADPLSASFPGVTSGNQDLMEETADTYTAGLVYQPRFLPGFNMTLDYWNINIEDAISTVTAQDIVDGCYQGATANDSFCELFSRNPNASSAQFGGFNFLRSTVVNFARIESDGYDLTANYNFEVGTSMFDTGLNLTKVRNLDFYTNPTDDEAVNPELGETQTPELSGNVYLNWSLADLSVGVQTQYVGEQLLQGVEVETYDALYGDAVKMDDLWLVNLNARYMFSDRLSVYGGINNVTDEAPYITSVALPVSARGRYMFAGFKWEM